ncbi:serine/threonine-protein kinase [uncultured Azohydromonas sp.]|uniref:serine/threonine protein kinase n=1 Tax=uncultured Azohydromonas sp. TaxID=487342 RepID=UPI00261F11B7|nr:serine/threonine-protein kinase [uncultured Azohydromonas sp.]
MGVLPPGHLVAEFRIERVLGKGGFGIVYLAFDTRLERLVAVKEFMPQSLAQRLPDHSIEPLSERHRETFYLGLRSFIREARSLAKFKHPAVVEVYRFWEELGTAYMVMPFYEGQTLKQRLKSMAAPPPEEWLRELMERVLKGLDVVHQQGWLHRDIALDNILMLPGDRPLLIDFGSAKQDIGDATQALTVLLKPGYAPFEQYSDSGSLKQGPWTDLYAVGAMLYFAISGKMPVESVVRVRKDVMVSALTLGRGRYSAAFLQFIDHCLAVWPEHRPRNVTAALELLRKLDLQEKAWNWKKSGDERQDVHIPPISRNDRRRFRLPSGSRLPRSWAGGIAVLLGSLAGLVLWEPWSMSVIRVADKDSEIGDRPAFTASLPGDDYFGTPVAAKPDMPALPLPVPQMTEAPAPAPPVQLFANPATPERALENLLDERDPTIRMVMTPASEKLILKKQRLQFTVKAREPGFLYVFATGQQRGNLELLWPADDESLMGMEPSRAWRIDALVPAGSGSRGKRHIGVMVSKAPRDLAGAGWQRQGGVLSLSFSEASKTAAAPWFGLPNCAPVPGTCNAEFDATRIELAYSQPPSREARRSEPPGWRLATIRKAECESLQHLLTLDGNTLAQRRFAELGCRR